MEGRNNYDIFPAPLLTLFILMVYLSEVSGREETYRSGLQFYSTENRYLNRTYRVQHGVPSHVQCVRNCLMETDCVSANYIKTRHVCELNNASRAHRPDEFVEDFESVYFGADESPTLCSHEVQHSSCLEVLKGGQNRSGEYYIFPHNFSGSGLRVFCDMDTDSGGWIVFQRRINGTVAFDRDWLNYQVGFGQISGEFWLGNDNLRKLTEFTAKWQLRVDLMDWGNNASWASYGAFSVNTDNYNLKCTEYDVTSSAGNSMNVHDGMSFTTKDSDNDALTSKNCAIAKPGGWWYYRCVKANLNGVYFDYPFATATDKKDMGIIWSTLTGSYYSLKSCDMKIREIS